jgi:hypothetical protein
LWSAAKNRTLSFFTACHIRDISHWECRGQAFADQISAKLWTFHANASPQDRRFFHQSLGLIAEPGEATARKFDHLGAK